jgi:hypothetical protein
LLSFCYQLFTKHSLCFLCRSSPLIFFHQGLFPASQPAIDCLTCCLSAAAAAAPQQAVRLAADVLASAEHRQQYDKRGLAALGGSEYKLLHDFMARGEGRSVHPCVVCACSPTAATV